MLCAFFNSISLEVINLFRKNLFTFFQTNPSSKPWQLRCRLGSNLSWCVWAISVLRYRPFARQQIPQTVRSSYLVPLSVARENSNVGNFEHFVCSHRGLPWWSFFSLNREADSSFLGEGSHTFWRFQEPFQCCHSSFVPIFSYVCWVLSVIWR